jgi:hypothetical protein
MRLVRNSLLLGCRCFWNRITKWFAIAMPAAMTKMFPDLAAAQSMEQESATHHPARAAEPDTYGHYDAGMIDYHSQ